MEAFFEMRETVSFLCNGEGTTPNPEDHLEKRTINRFLHPETYYVLPNGTIHGKYTIQSDNGRNFLEKTISFGVLEGPYLCRKILLVCEGNCEAGVPKGTFSIVQFSDMSQCTVTYKNGVAVSHEYKGDGHCPLRCHWDHEMVIGKHSLSWSFREPELSIVLRTDKGVKRKNIKFVYERNFYFENAPPSQPLVFCNPCVLPTKRTFCLEKNNRYVFLP